MKSDPNVQSSYYIIFGLPGASEAETGRVHLHEPVEPGDLDVHPLRLHRGQHRTLPRVQVRGIQRIRLFKDPNPVKSGNWNVCVPHFLSLFYFLLYVPIEI